MSHFTTIQTEIRDVDALRDACAELGVELLQDTEARGFAGQTRQGNYVIRLNGPYDIAVNHASNGDQASNGNNGSLELSTDWWEGHVEKEVGPNFGRLLQLYGVHKTIREARRKRLRVRRKQEADGSIKLTLTA